MCELAKYNKAIKDRPQKGLWAGPPLLRSSGPLSRRYKSRGINKLTIYHKQIQLFIMLSFTLIAGCELDFNLQSNSGIRSGNLDNDYIEQPLSKNVNKYKQALNTSNEIIDLIQVRDYGQVYDRYLDASAKQRIDKTVFMKVMSDNEENWGAVVKYKPMQWGFYPRTEDGDDLLHSVKIVEQSKDMMKYIFTFKDDDQYQKVIGFMYRIKDGVALPGQI